MKNKHSLYEIHLHKMEQYYAHILCKVTISKDNSIKIRYGPNKETQISHKAFIQLIKSVQESMECDNISTHTFG